MTNVEPQASHSGRRRRIVFSRSLSTTLRAASLRESHGVAIGSTARVSVRTLDEFVEQHGIERIQFMKLDVEGFESEVFAGSHRVLMSLRPDAILFEMNDQSPRPLIEHSVFSILDQLDYAFLCLPKGLFSVRPQAIDPKTATTLPGHDVIAAPKGVQFDHAVEKMHALA